MKKSIVVILFLATLVGCKKDSDSMSTVMDFEVTISRVESHRVWLDIIPKNEFLPYFLDWMPIDIYNADYASDEEYLNYITKLLSSFSDDDILRSASNEGAYMSSIRTEPNTKYVLLISQLNGKKATVLNKKTFTSREEHMTPFTLVADSIHCGGDGRITINPADTVDTYYWDFDLKTTVNRNWHGAHSVLFYYDMEFYYSMDFFPDILCQGFDEDSLYDYFLPSELAVGDTICLVAVGYDETGETSPAYMPFWIIYQGLNNDAIVVDAEPDGFESIYRKKLVYKPQRKSDAFNKRHKKKQRPN